MPKGKVTNGSVGSSRNSLRIHSFGKFEPTGHAANPPFMASIISRATGKPIPVKVLSYDADYERAFVKITEGICRGSTGGVLVADLGEAL